MNYTIKTIPINQLKPHEQIIPGHLFQLQAKITADGYFTHPIVIDRTSKIILDGHHRYRALERLGHHQIPCILVNYLSPQITFYSQTKNINKQTVIDCALRGNLLRPKTTKHYLRIAPGQQIALEKIKTKTKILLINLT